MSNKLRQRGFTMVEIIVALTLVAVGILATASVASVTVRAGTDNANRVIATNLSREGIELVRNIRDSNWAIQAWSAQTGQPANSANAWDCYPSSPESAIAAPFPCGPNPRLGLGTETIFAVSARLDGLGAPYLEVANGNQNIKSATFRLCQDPQSKRFYSNQGGGACPSGPTFFRQMRITKGKDLATSTGTPTYSLRVQSYVTWIERATVGTGGPIADRNLRAAIVLEEYITDWQVPTNATQP